MSKWELLLGQGPKIDFPPTFPISKKIVLRLSEHGDVIKTETITSLSFPKQWWRDSIQWLQ